MGSTRVARLVKHLALGFSSGHDLTVMRSSPVSGSSMESVWDSLPLSLCLSLSLSNKQKKYLKKFYLNLIWTA